MRTWFAKKMEVDRNWWLVDAADQNVGHIATRIAVILRGKNKPTFTPQTDTGDFVVVVNSKKIKLSGNKMQEKKYYRHSRYFGSLKETSAEKMLEKDPNTIIIEAVRGMLPTNKLSRQLIKKLKVYEGAEHPHTAQKVQALTIK